MELTKRFSAEQFARGLESWGWLGIGAKAPVLATLFGDVILQDGRSFWFLDSVGGSLTPTWSSVDALKSDLNTAEGQDRYLLGGLAMAAERNGLVLGPNDVYDFTIPPILGGKFDVDNVKVMDFVVSLYLAGQLLDQVKSLPPGTKISGFTVDGQQL